jgi:2-oxoglutarate dehydrogenase E2 component (dihydrolipoamide succinyltransferase)
MATDIVVPTLGESVTEATIAQWLKKPGEAVALDEPLVELETDKVTLEVNAREAGVLAEILADEGDNVEVGALLGRIDPDGVAKAAAATESVPEPALEPTAQAAPAAPAAPAAAPGGAAVEILVPVMGESVTEGMVAQWLKQPGDAVAQDEPVVEVETDKVTLEVNAPAAGVLEKILAEEGATVEVGAVLGTVAAGATAVAAAAAPALPAPAPEPTAPAEAAPPEPAAAPASGDGLDPAAVGRSAAGERISKADLLAFIGAPAPTTQPLSPAVRKLVSDQNLDPSLIPATGPNGRLTKEDVIDFMAGKAAAIPSTPTPVLAPRPAAAPVTAASAPAASEAAREERVRMPKLRQTIARRLKEAQNTAAMLTTFNEADMSAVMALRAQYRDSFEKKHGVRLGFTSFFTKAVVAALKEMPAVNAEIDGDEIVYKHYYDVGMAVSAPSGLMVPVIRDCDKKSFAEIESALVDLATRAREGKLGLDEMTGGTFTITNGGVFGSLLSTPILNMPQSGILGLHKIQQRPMAVDGEIKLRPMMYLALSYDHRVIDGREAVTFLVRVKDFIEDPERLLLDI